VGKVLEKQSLGRPRKRSKENIKMICMEISCDD
jgi:hypothetical protein